MKKWLLFFLIQLSFRAVNSQAQSKFHIGGSLGIDNVTITDELQEHEQTISTFMIMPTIGYAITKRVTIGGSLGIRSTNFGYEDLDVGGSSSSELTMVETNMYLRFYHAAEKKGRFFWQIEPFFAIQTSTGGREIMETGIRIKPGLSYAPNPKITFNFTLGHISYVSEYSEEYRETKSKFDVNIFSKSTLGIQFNLGTH